MTVRQRPNELPPTRSEEVLPPRYADRPVVGEQHHPIGAEVTGDRDLGERALQPGQVGPNPGPQLRSRPRHRGQGSRDLPPEAAVVGRVRHGGDGIEKPGARPCRPVLQPVTACFGRVRDDRSRDRHPRPARLHAEVDPLQEGGDLLTAERAPQVREAVGPCQGVVLGRTVDRPPPVRAHVRGGPPSKGRQSPGRVVEVRAREAHVVEVDPVQVIALCQLERHRDGAFAHGRAPRSRVQSFHPLAVGARPGQQPFRIAGIVGAHCSELAR